MSSYLVGTRWAARRTETRAPCGTGSLSVPVRSGPESRKLPQAHNRNPTFPEEGVSAAPSRAGVLRTPNGPRPAGGSRSSTSRLDETPTVRLTGLNGSAGRGASAGVGLDVICLSEGGRCQGGRR